MTDEKPTTAERYSTATQTTDMTVRRLVDGPGPADYIIASGWARGHGAVFVRLRGEFDQAHAEVAQIAAGRNVGAVNLRLLAMLRLKTLAHAKHILFCLAEDKAADRFPALLDKARELAWQALSAWLDPRCTHCDGRGFNGGSHRGEHKTYCSHCKTTGNRRGFIGKSDAERSFVNALLNELDEAVGGHAGQVSARIRG